MRRSAATGGRTWRSISGDLPEREVAYTLIQDHVKPELLFIGTEFGLYVTLDEGAHWHRLKGGLPTIQVRDLDIQREWEDLAVATFGRGFYILDDYTPLREMTEERLENEASILFPARGALRYIEKRDRIGDRGDTFWTASNPPYGAVLTYWLRDGIKTKREVRTEAEKEAREAETETPLASMAELREEDLEIEPGAFIVVRDDQGSVIRRVAVDRKEGLHRVAWDLRWPAAAPTDLSPEKDRAPWEEPERGPLVLPGSYTASLEERSGGEWKPLSGPVSFDVEALDLATLTAADKTAVEKFQQEVRELRRAVLGASELTGEVKKRLDHLRQALVDTPEADPALMTELEGLQARFDAILLELKGDTTKGRRNVFTPPSIVSRVERIASDQWYTTQAPTTTHRQAFEWAADAFATELEKLEQLFTDLEALEAKAEEAKAPWTPGRVPTR